MCTRMEKRKKLPCDCPPMQQGNIHYIHTMMEQIIIRQAAIGDLDILLGFEQEIIKTERPFDPTLQPGLISYYDIKTMITEPEVRVMLAETEEKIIASGYARIQNAEPYLRHASFAFLGFMYVLPEYRGKGINSRIIEALTAWAAEQGITEIRLDVYFKNLAAIKAYEKIGFVPHMVEMRREH
jgi:GNAT superfamily N-acetyltransferase